MAVTHLARIENFRVHDSLRHIFASYLVMNERRRSQDGFRAACACRHQDDRALLHLSSKHKPRAVKILVSALQTDRKTDTVESSKSVGRAKPLRLVELARIELATS